HMSLAHRPNDWMVIGFESVIKETPLRFCRLDIPFEPVKKFFISAWIQNRLLFYRRESKKSKKNYRILSVAGELLFFITLILATIHALEIGHMPKSHIDPSLVIAALTITLPAFAAAVSSIRIQREYLRNSERYSHIAKHIASVKNEIVHVKNMNQLREFLEEMNEITLREQQDWRIIFRFREIEAV
ncbi:MAG: SLATT domain-containing protein, partial [Methanomicrobium sp.]|nr:SLATT domain-containing protein [Methanomicrobium sp.]